jgi:hypothetical protein
LITYAEAASRVYPFNGALIADKPAASAFQAAFIGKGNMLVSENIAIGRTGINANRHVTFPAF